MPTNVLMPALSPTMTEGKIARWLKAEGDTVKSGQVLCEIETDKATMEVEAVDEGVLAKIVVPGGTEGVKVNELIAVIAGEGEDAKAVAAKGAAPVAALAAAAPVAAAPAAAPAPVAAAAAAPQGARVFASPLARRIAEQSNLDLGKIAGSGPGGRIVKRDVEAALAGGNAKISSAAAAPAAAAASAAPALVAVSSAALAAIGLPRRRAEQLPGMVEQQQAPGAEVHRRRRCGAAPVRSRVPASSAFRTKTEVHPCPRSSSTVRPAALRAAIIRRRPRVPRSRSCCIPIPSSAAR
jgi:pyruvate/2-oxoglutarate dehydrogenase complex dihydrolipoamide acyltransferase (E2) component